ncbi:MAG: hypothetical protein DRN78_02100 [Thermoproteota archaeon]|nr:MAG: hypothetical protein DRN78_02100 [Candidatus Korarchaeota archaeon]
MFTKSYRDGVVTRVFEGANLVIEEGDFIGLFAPSGYGKSTLIFLIAGLEKPDKGSIIVNGRDITKLGDRELALYRRKEIGIVFQSFNLFPYLTALENVMIPMELIGIPRKEARKRAMELLRIVGMEKNANKFPSQLSGGEQQRVAIARALANNPRIILADEPTGNLDEKNAIAIFNLFKELNERGVTILLATP